MVRKFVCLRFSFRWQEYQSRSSLHCCPVEQGQKLTTFPVCGALSSSTSKVCLPAIRRGSAGATNSERLRPRQISPSHVANSSSLSISWSRNTLVTSLEVAGPNFTLCSVSAINSDLERRQRRGRAQAGSLGSARTVWATRRRTRRSHIVGADGELGFSADRAGPLVRGQDYQPAAAQ